jgi:acetoacetyl-CoA synthetase
VGEQPMWTPSPERMESALLTSFLRGANARWGMSLEGHPGLHRWSVESPEAFWRTVWDFCGIVGEQGGTVLQDGARMPGARWFPEARLNFARNLLVDRGASDALVSWGENMVRRRLSHAELYQAVARLAAAFRGAGLAAGDRVAAYMPNMPETVVAMLAAASLGAVFSTCSPDFGVQGVVDRFGQIAPKILVAADGYFHNGKTFDSLGKLAQVADQLDSLGRVVVVPYVREAPDLTGVRGARLLSDFTAPHAEETEIAFTPLPFDHPLYILYSSGTTGVPKCIVHGAGGTLLQHLKEIGRAHV